jgi:NDP-sugar pyrophosphorylase family protein
VKAVLLAAGLGTRLGALTEYTPKCMLEIGGCPVLERNINWLVAGGVCDLAINLHHGAEIVRTYFGDGRAHGATVRWSHEVELLGTAGTLASLRSWIGSEEFLVVYADNLIGCHLHAFVASHHVRVPSATVALFERDDVSASGVAELTRDDQIVRFVEKPGPGETASHWVSAGLLMLGPRALALAPERGDIGLDLLPKLLDAGEPVSGYRMGSDEPLRWIDTLADLEQTELAVGGAR